MDFNFNIDGFLSLAGGRKEHVGPLTTFGLVTFELMADALGIVKTSLHARLRRHPDAFPQPVELPGVNRLYFRLCDLQQWSQGFRQTARSVPDEKTGRTRGRPSKVLKLAAATAGVSVKEYRALVRAGGAGVKE